jgi:hypothetical protein
MNLVDEKNGVPIGPRVISNPILNILFHNFIHAQLKFLILIYD